MLCLAGAAPLQQSWLDRLFPGLDVAPSEGCPAEANVQLPPGLRLESLAAQHNEDLSAAAAFNFNLGALSLLAAAVAAFLVHQVVVLGVSKQTLEFGRLRALGMSGSEVGLRLMLGYVGVAAFAGALGVLLGGLLAQLLVERVSAVVNDLFYRVAVSAVRLDVVSATKGMAVAIGVAVLASVGPAVRIARTPPVRLMRGEPDVHAKGLSPWFGVSCLAAMLLLLICTSTTVGALLAIGFALLATVGLAGKLLPRFRPAPQMAVVPRLALADLDRTGRDAGLALGALVIAVATAFGMAWMIASFRGALTSVLEQRLTADVLVRVDAADSHRLQTLMQLPGLTEIALAGHDELRMPRSTPTSSAAAPMHSLLTTALRVVDAPATEARRIGLPIAALAAPQVALSEPLAHRLGLRTGDDVQVGRCRLRVGGVFKEYGSVQGRLTAARTVLAPCLALPPATEAEIHGNVTAAQVRAALAGTRDLMVAVPAQVRSVALAIFDRTFAVTQVVRWLALLVAAIALFASLSIWMSQRAAELGVLRALGLSGAELGQVLALQTLLLGTMAILLALPLGALIAWILTAELHPRAFGWSFPLQLSISTIADTLVVALLAVLAGALFPVLTLARTPAVHWLREARHG